MSLQNRLILFFFVTSLGSALSSIATFLSIESYFQSLILLGFALSVRTLASAVFSYYSNNIIQCLGLRNSLLASQIFGCLALIVLVLGFHFDMFVVTLFGIVLTGLPSSFVAILLTIILRVSSENPELFRKYSGRRELVFGIGMLIASIATPLLLMKFNLYTILLLDGISYVTGLLLLSNIKLTEHVSDESDKKSIVLRRLLFKSVNVDSFLIKTSASLLLAGLLPLLASSGKIQFTMDMPILLRQWLWAIEDITAISASLIYLIFVILRRQKWFDAVLMLSGIWLVIPLIAVNNYSIVIAAVVICLLTDFSGQKFRDDLIVSAGNDVIAVKAYSALAQFQRNFIFFISPILLSFLFSYTNAMICIIVIFSMQLILYVIHKYFQKNYIYSTVSIK